MARQQTAVPGGTIAEHVYDLIGQAPHTPAELVKELGISRNGVQKGITALREAGLIHVIGTAYAGAKVWALMDVPEDPNYYLKVKLGVDVDHGVRVTVPRDDRAGVGVFPAQFDQLIVTGVGVDSITGHRIAKLQRKDGVTWVVDLEGVVAA